MALSARALTEHVESHRIASQNTKNSPLPPNTVDGQCIDAVVHSMLGSLSNYVALPISPLALVVCRSRASGPYQCLISAAGIRAERNL